MIQAKQQVQDYLAKGNTFKDSYDLTVNQVGQLDSPIQAIYLGIGVTYEPREFIRNSLRNVNSNYLQSFNLISYHTGLNDVAKMITDTITRVQARKVFDKNVYKQLSPYYSKAEVKGITTSPDEFSLALFENHINSLTKDLTFAELDTYIHSDLGTMQTKFMDVAAKRMPITKKAIAHVGDYLEGNKYVSYIDTPSKIDNAKDIHTHREVLFSLNFVVNTYDPILVKYYNSLDSHPKSVDLSLTKPNKLKHPQTLEALALNIFALIAYVPSGESYKFILTKLIEIYRSYDKYFTDAAITHFKTTLKPELTSWL